MPGISRPAPLVPRRGDWDRFHRHLDEVTGSHSSGRNDVRLLVDGDQFLDSLRPELARATRSIGVELFKVTDDSVSQEVVDALIAKAREGVTVRVILDQLGSRHAGRLVNSCAKAACRSTFTRRRCCAITSTTASST
jgi:phosphatidylserine/phosphatidylglycerophosphate/cardiolipin synthase-like enzyme